MGAPHWHGDNDSYMDAVRGGERIGRVVPLGCGGLFVIFVLALYVLGVIAQGLGY
jgi:hypothetical protein